MGRRRGLGDSALPQAPGATPLGGVEAAKRRSSNLGSREEGAITRDAERTKSAFLASISQELRTPLNAVIGYAELVQRRFTELDDHRHVDYAIHIRESGEHLLALISDILDVSRLEHERHDLWPEPLDVASELAWVRKMVAPRYEETGATIETKTEAGAEQLVYDQRAFRQILLNLVTNAVKYGRSGGTVEVAATPGIDGLQLIVVDDGPGIPDDQQQQLFQPFARGTSRLSRECEGTGLGLYLCKKLAERAGGWISLESTSGLGTKVTVMMPSASDSTPS